MGSIWSKEPAVIIGALIAVALQVVGAFVDQGLISEVFAGRATDIINALGAAGVSLIALLTAVLIRPAVFSPKTYEEK